MSFKPKKLIYLANAYTSKKTDKDAKKLEEVQRRHLESFIGGKLKKLHPEITIILPIAVSGSMADLCDFGTGFDTWKDDDFTFISKCDEVWVLVSDGWTESYGVQEEIQFALKHEIPVKYVNKNTLDVTNVPYVTA